MRHWYTRGLPLLLTDLSDAMYSSWYKGQSLKQLVAGLEAEFMNVQFR
jgi:hypothetical protein